MTSEPHFEYSASRVPVPGWNIAVATAHGHEFRLQAIVTPNTDLAELPSVGITPATVFGQEMMDEELATLLTILYLNQVPEGFYDGIHFRYEV